MSMIKTLGKRTLSVLELILTHRREHEILRENISEMKRKIDRLYDVLISGKV